MSRGRDRIVSMLVALVMGSLAVSSAGAEPPGASATTGTVRLDSGRTAHFAYHYDRNAMADAFIAGDAIVALTDAGTLLRFDRTSLKLSKEWIGTAAATCLGRDTGGALLAGFADGRIARVDPNTLAVAEVARVPEKLQWAGAVGGGKPRIVAVVERMSTYKDEDGDSHAVPVSIVRDLGRGKEYPIDPARKPYARADAFLLDRKHRLWLGADNGEWGGWCYYLDLDEGEVHDVPGLHIYDKAISPDPAWHGVFGFHELRDGQVWAYGGITHMGSTEGYIWRVDLGKAEERYRLDNWPDNIEAFRTKQMAEARQRREEAIKKGLDPDEVEAKREPEPDPEPDPLPTDRPYVPITQVTEDSRDGSLHVVAFSDIYRTDARLARWEKIHTLKIRYRWGRPDAVGAYPSVRSVLPVKTDGKSTGLIFATRMDGLIRLIDGKETDAALPGQLGMPYVGRIVNSSEGLLALSGTSDAETWRYRDGAWKPISFAPALVPLADFEKDAKMGPDDWQQSLSLVNRDGMIVTVNVSPAMPGTCTTARWRTGKAEVLGSEVTMLSPSACFLTPDGGIWNADGVTLKRLVEGHWAEVARFDWPRGVGRPNWPGVGWDLRAVNDGGPPWILHDPTNNVLVRLSYAGNFKEPKLEAIPLRQAEPPRPIEVRDAIPWQKGTLLLATNRGLETFTIEGNWLDAPKLNTAGRTIARLVVDGLGRLWLGGEGLAVLDKDGRTLHPLDALPVPGRSTIAALAADPDHPDGVVVAAEGRGIVFVRVEAGR